MHKPVSAIVYHDAMRQFITKINESRLRVNLVKEARQAQHAWHEHTSTHIGAWFNCVISTGGTTVSYYYSIMLSFIYIDAAPMLGVRDVLFRKQ